MKKIVISLVLLMVLVIGGGWTMVINYLATGNNLSEAKEVQVKSGATMMGTLNLLADEGVITRPAWLYYYARANKKTALKAGLYEFPAGITPREVLDKLSRGDIKIVQVPITIPEGLNIYEIFKIVDKSELGIKEADLFALCRDEAFLKEMGIKGPSCEGYLFPETYNFDRTGTTAQALLVRMIKLFKKNFTPEIESAGAQLGLSPLEIVTMASIIQKETRIEAEMPKISGVFQNRLKKGMKLQTDPTVIYAKTLEQGYFDGNITKRDLQREHPYNTYTSCTALPPGPIASPGIKALDAAVHPADSQDLFFMATGDGGHEFCPTLSCHNEALKRYLRKMGYQKK